MFAPESHAKARRFALNVLPIIFLIVLGGVIWRQNQLRPEAVFDLDGLWSYCHTHAGFDSAGCEWRSIRLPAELPLEQADRFTGYLVYRKELPPTKECGRQECALLAGEVGDAAEVFFNGRSAGRFGDFPPNAQYHKNFPVMASLPDDWWRADASNSLELHVYSFKVPQTGPRQGPLVITSSAQARLFSYLKVGRNVFAPLACAVAILIVCCLTGLFPLKTIRDLRLMPSFVTFCVVSCLFLISFSEVPRRFLPVVVAIPLHFLLRYGSDWVFFRLLCRFFGFRARWTLWLNGAYAVAVVSEGIFLLGGVVGCSTGALFSDVTILTTTYRSIYLFGFLLPLGPAVGAYGSWKMKSDWRWSVVVCFLCIMAGQIYDYMVYAAGWQGDYVSKFHHLLIALFFSGLLIRRAAALQMASMLSEKSNVMREADISAGRLALQVAHDIRSPLAALSTIQDDSRSLPEDSRVLMRMAIERIEDICNTLRGQHGGHLENKDESSQIVDVGDTLALLIAERRLAWGSGGPVLRQQSTGQSYGAFVEGRRRELAVVLSNLINNAGEACRDNGLIEIALSTDATRIQICVADNGVGMNEEQVALLGRRGYTEGKADGTGLGVHHAMQTLRQWGGRILYSSSPGNGTRAVIELPRVSPPEWFCPEIEVALNGTIVILDDDDSIHDIWNRRFEKVKRIIGDVIVKSFRSAADVMAYVQGGGLASLYLLDHELVGDSRTGLQIAHELGLCTESILVTSHAGEREVQAACAEFGMRLIPKGLAMQVPITVRRPKKVTRLDAEAWL